ncbi:MAG: hypothetical protein JOZ84_03790 [Methylobacteriaceae bacterium]|nr:hypothetical protein [Methylobacteriaceae bacterium]
MTNVRRQSKGLNTDQVKELDYGWRHAAIIGRPLNLMISTRPIDVDELALVERCQLFAAVRNKLGVYARLRGFEPTFVWSREVNPDGTGEHMHVLMHVPSKYRAEFEQTVLGWLPGAAEIDVIRANQKTRFTWNGRRLSAVGYISKQMTPQAWYRRGLLRKPGGAVLGKTGGITKNLDRRAREAFRGSWPAFGGSSWMPPSRLLAENQHGAGIGASPELEGLGNQARMQGGGLR